jgi:hypothetical protein
MAQCRIRVLASASLIRMQGVTTPPSTGREAVQGRLQQFCASKITQLALTCARPGDHLRHGVGSQAHGLSVEMGGGMVLGWASVHAADFSALSLSAFLPLPTPTREADSFKAGWASLHTVSPPPKPEALTAMWNSCCRGCRTICPSSISAWCPGHNLGP